MNQIRFDCPGCGQTFGRGFAMLPNRWLAERTFAWLCNQRRLARNYERKTQYLEVWLYRVMSGLMLRRLASQRQK